MKKDLQQFQNQKKIIKLLQKNQNQKNKKMKLLKKVQIKKQKRNIMYQY